MGADFLTKTLPGNLTKKQLTEKFVDMQDTASDEHGSSYSGDWNMCTGLKIHDEVIAGEEEAETFLDKRCEKWREAHAVRFTRNHVNIPGLSPEGDGRYVQLRSGKLYAMYQQLGHWDAMVFRFAEGMSEEDQRRLQVAAEAAWEASRTIPEQNDFFCLAHCFAGCRKELTEAEINRMLELRPIVAARYKNDDVCRKLLTDLESEIAAKLKGTTVTHWMIAGLCAS